jgi:hypothetical protein
MKVNGNQDGNMAKAVLRYQMTWCIVGAGLTMFLTAVACTSEPITLKQHALCYCGMLVSFSCRSRDGKFGWEGHWVQGVLTGEGRDWKSDSEHYKVRLFSRVPSSCFPMAV